MVWGTMFKKAFVFVAISSLAGCDSLLGPCLGANHTSRVEMKGTNMAEDRVIILLEPANQWTEICTDIT
jgi:hypothetical protein